MKQVHLPTRMPSGAASPRSARTPFCWVWAFAAAGLIVGLPRSGSSFERPSFPVATTALRFDAACEGAGYDVPVAGPDGRVWVSHDDGLMEWDVSDPAAPRPGGAITLPQNARQRPVLVGDTLAVLAERGSILLVDVSVRGHPRLVRGIEAVLRDAPNYTGKVVGKCYRSVAADGEALVTVGWEQVSGRTTIERWDVSNPERPVRLASRELPGANWWTCTPFYGEECPVTSIDRGVVVESDCWNAETRDWRSCFDLFRREELAPLGRTMLPERSVSPSYVGLDHRESTVVYRDSGGDVHEIALEPQATSCRLSEGARAFWFAATPTGAIQVSAHEQWIAGVSVGPECDVRSTAKMYMIPGWNGSYTAAVDPTGSFAFLPDADRGLRSIALGDPPREAGGGPACARRHRRSTAGASTPDGKWFYVATGEEFRDEQDTPELVVIDRRDAGRPRVAGWIELDSEVSSLRVSGNFLFGLWLRELTLIDLADPSAPRWLWTIPRENPRGEAILGVFGDRLLLGGAEWIEEWQVSSEGEQRFLGVAALGDESSQGGSFAFDEPTKTLWVARSSGRSIEAWDLSVPLAPKRVRGPIAFPSDARLDRLAVVSGRPFAASSQDVFRLEASLDGNGEFVHAWSVPGNFLLGGLREIEGNLVASLVDRWRWFSPDSVAVFDVAGDSGRLGPVRLVDDAWCGTPMPGGWANLGASSIRFVSLSSAGSAAGFVARGSGRTVAFETVPLAPNDGVGWDFGDGTLGWGTRGVSHSYRESGRYFVTQTVYRVGGVTSSSTRELDIP